MSEQTPVVRLANGTSVRAVMHLPLDAISADGTTVDIGSSSRRATAVRATVVTDETFGHAALFDGVGGRITIAEATCPTSFTFAAFVWSSTANSSSYVSLMEFGTAAPWFGLLRGQVLLYRGPRCPDVFEREAWHHVAVSYDHSTRRSSLFIDGAQVASSNYAGKMTGRGLGIGRHVCGRYFAGRMRDVMVFDEPLGAEAVGWLYRTLGVAETAQIPRCVLHLPLVDDTADASDAGHVLVTTGVRLAKDDSFGLAARIDDHPGALRIDALQCPDAFTFVATIKLDARAKHPMSVMQFGASGPKICAAGGRIELVGGASSAALALDTWHNIAVTCDPATGASRVLVEGQSAVVGAYAGAEAGAGLTIGGRRGENFMGSLRNVVLYEGACDDAEIHAAWQRCAAEVDARRSRLTGSLADLMLELRDTHKMGLATALRWCAPIVGDPAALLDGAKAAYAAKPYDAAEALVACGRYRREAIADAILPLLENQVTQAIAAASRYGRAVTLTIGGNARTLPGGFDVARLKGYVEHALQAITLTRAGMSCTAIADALDGIRLEAGQDRRIGWALLVAGHPPSAICDAAKTLWNRSNTQCLGLLTQIGLSPADVEAVAYGHLRLRAVPDLSAYRLTGEFNRDFGADTGVLAGSI